MVIRTTNKYLTPNSKNTDRRIAQLSKKVDNANDGLHSLQKAVAGLREQLEEFREQYDKDQESRSRYGYKAIAKAKAKTILPWERCF